MEIQITRIEEIYSEIGPERWEEVVKGSGKEGSVGAKEGRKDKDKSSTKTLVPDSKQYPVSAPVCGNTKTLTAKEKRANSSKV
jgi:hypothetical protein